MHYVSIVQPPIHESLSFVRRNHTDPSQYAKGEMWPSGSVSSQSFHQDVPPGADSPTGQGIVIVL